MLADNFSGDEIVFNVSLRKMRTARMMPSECVLRKANKAAKWDKRRSWYINSRRSKTFHGAFHGVLLCSRMSTRRLVKRRFLKSNKFQVEYIWY